MLDHTVERTTVFLTYPSTARDEYGNLGTWTMVYNQVNLRKRLLEGIRFLKKFRSWYLIIPNHMNQYFQKEIDTLFLSEHPRFKKMVQSLISISGPV